jgi:hypothetical protein
MTIRLYFSVCGTEQLRVVRTFLVRGELDAQQASKVEIEKMYKLGLSVRGETSGTRVG